MLAIRLTILAGSYPVLEIEDRVMAWVYLLLAGLCEIGWPIGLKLGWAAGGLRYGWLAFAILCIIASGGLLLLALREIPVGTAYAVWTGIGAVGAFLVGITLFGDANTALRWASVALITAGIIGLKLA
jgi:quaternary ammonium compound-resistance protein SugE